MLWNEEHWQWIEQTWKRSPLKRLTISRGISFRCRWDDSLVRTKKEERWQWCLRINLLPICCQIKKLGANSQFIFASHFINLQCSEISYNSPLCNSSVKREKLSCGFDDEREIFSKEIWIKLNSSQGNWTISFVQFIILFVTLTNFLKLWYC